MAVDGSTTRQSFFIRPEGTIEIDITRVIFQIICNDPPEFDDFGDITGGLQRGVVFRQVNGGHVNLFNLKTNGEIANLMYDVEVYEQSKVQGVNGISGRLTYGGPSKHGVTLRIGNGTYLEVIIQDDLSSLATFKLIASGHVVE